MEKLTIFLIFLFVDISEAIRLYRTTANLKEFISNKNSNKTSYLEIHDSKLANVIHIIGLNRLINIRIYFRLMNLQYV